MGVFKSGSTKSRSNGGKTIIAAGCKISGELIDLDGDLHIDGLVEGVVETEQGVSVGKMGAINGLVKATTIIVSGVLEGKVVCEKIDILATGKVLGEVVCSEMMIEAGGKFIGESRELTEGGLIVSFPAEERTKWVAQLVEKSAKKLELVDLELEEKSKK